MCGEEEETTSHLFCTCRVTWLIWSKCYEWVGLALVVHQDPKIHFHSFGWLRKVKLVEDEALMIPNPRRMLKVGLLLIGLLLNHS